MFSDDIERRIAEATQQDTDHSLPPTTKNVEILESGKYKEGKDKFLNKVL